MCQFENESKETKVIFALMARKVEEFKEQDKEYPANVRKILDEFSDLWPAELPNQFLFFFCYVLIFGIVFFVLDWCSISIH